MLRFEFQKSQFDLYMGNRQKKATLKVKRPTCQLHNLRNGHDSLGQSSGNGDKYKQINLKSIWFRSQNWEDMENDDIPRSRKHKNKYFYQREVMVPILDVGFDIPECSLETGLS